MRDGIITRQRHTGIAKHFRSIMKWWWSVRLFREQLGRHEKLLPAAILRVWRLFWRNGPLAACPDSCFDLDFVLGMVYSRLS